MAMGDREGSSGEKMRICANWAILRLRVRNLQCKNEKSSYASAPVLGNFGFWAPHWISETYALVDYRNRATEPCPADASQTEKAAVLFAGAVHVTFTKDTNNRSDTNIKVPLHLGITLLGL